MHTVPPVQALPQLPQLASLVCRSKQVLVHRVSPAVGHLQLPNEHCVPAGQASSQAPQCWLFVHTSTHALALVQYSCVPPEQSQLPKLHTSEALHFVSQLPQCVALLWVSTHLPSAAQYFWPPCGQTHTPELHVSVGLQPLPQLPQLDASVASGTHWPAASQ
jgi:hypothetical protein